MMLCINLWIFTRVWKNLIPPLGIAAMSYS